MASLFMQGYEAHSDPKVSKNRNVVIKNKEGGDLRLLVVEGVEQSDLQKGGKRPVVLAIHGGGGVIGIAEMDHGFHVQLVKAGFTVISPDYRLAPEHRYPAALEDIESTWDFLLDAKNGLNIDTERMFLFGNSFGACLSAGLTHRLKERGEKQPQLSILDSFYGDSGTDYPHFAADHPFTPYFNPWSRKNGIDTAPYLYPEGMTKVPVEAAPLVSTSKEDFAGLGPHYITSSELDTLADHGLFYYQKLRDAGVSVGFKIFRGHSHAVISIFSQSKTAKDIGEEYVRAYLEVL